jgi:hypothetical protein
LEIFLKHTGFTKKQVVHIFFLKFFTNCHFKKSDFPCEFRLLKNPSFWTNFFTGARELGF